MEATKVFKETIKSYLDNRALEDKLFATSYAKENKNLDDCVKYILGSVKESGRNGFTDDEVYSMAVHYYDEDDIKVGDLPANIQIAVNHMIELTDEEKRQAREDAIADYGRQYIASQKKKAEKPKKQVEEVVQGSLF